MNSKDMSENSPATLILLLELGHPRLHAPIL